MFNPKDFKIRSAIAFYLETPEEDVDWSKIEFIQKDEIITRWDNTQKPQPSIQQLKDLWFPYYYKQKQLKLIKEQFENWVESGGVGCQTTVPDGEGGYIRVDCKKTATKDDVQNFEKLKFFLEQTGQTGTYIKDYYNKMRYVTLSDLESIVLQLIGYGLNLYQIKWQKEALIEAMDQEEEESIEGYVSRLETINFPE